MKKTIVLLLTLAASATRMSADPTASELVPPPTQPNLDKVSLETTAKIEKTVSQDDLWMQADRGILFQFIKAPTLLAPIDPLATTEAGFGEKNISTDTVSGRAMGLQLIKFEF